jgi:cytochrome c553
MRKRKLVKLDMLKTAVLVVALSAAPAWAGEFNNVSVRNCTWCHGPSAQGYAPAPRLAGQRDQYIVNQLSSFRAHRRDNPFSKMYMWPASTYVGPEAVHQLADYFSRLHPRAAGDGHKSLVAAGRAIYQEGVPSANVAACVACHGPRAQGIGQIPRLGGLSYSYLRNRLEQWHDGFDATALHPMPHVASALSSRQIAALASYLSFIK